MTLTWTEHDDKGDYGDRNVPTAGRRVLAVSYYRSYEHLQTRVSVVCWFQYSIILSLLSSSVYFIYYISVNQSDCLSLTHCLFIYLIIYLYVYLFIYISIHSLIYIYFADSFSSCVQLT